VDGVQLGVGVAAVGAVREPCVLLAVAVRREAPAQRTEPALAGQRRRSRDLPVAPTGRIPPRRHSCCERLFGSDPFGQVGPGVAATGSVSLRCRSKDPRDRIVSDTTNSA